MKIHITDWGRYHTLIPNRAINMRYSAIDNDTYDGPPSPMGWGATPQEAERDLLDQIGEDEEGDDNDR